MSELDKLFSDMEDTTWDHSGDREAANVGYVVTTEKTFQGAKLEAANLRAELDMLKAERETSFAGDTFVIEGSGGPYDSGVVSQIPPPLSPPSEA